MSKIIFLDVDGTLVDYDCIRSFPRNSAGGSWTGSMNGTWGGVGETALFGDLALKGINKGNAISRLLEHLNAKQEDTIAFGDAKVDIPMLEYCAVGVAMGNGGKEIKEAADFITDDVTCDGLFKAFEKLNLI